MIHQRSAVRRKALRFPTTLFSMFVAGLASVLVALCFVLWGPSLIAVDTWHVPVDLAPVAHASSQPGALQDDALIVSVARDGSVYFQESRIALEALPETLRDFSTTRANHKIYLKADARAKYGDVKAVIDCIRSAGVSDITLLTETAVQQR